MFGFNKKKHREQAPEAPPRKKTRIDKLIMGAIIGVAVGSVVGMTLLPHKDKKKKGFLRRILEILFQRQDKSGAPLKKIPREQIEREKENM